MRLCMDAFVRHDHVVRNQFLAVRLPHKYAAAKPYERDLALQDPCANRAGLEPQKRGGFVYV